MKPAPPTDRQAPIRVRFDGRTFVPLHPADVAEGEEGDVVMHAPSPVRDSAQESAFERLLRRVRELNVRDDLPADLAAQHDHYLYGTPKDPENEFKP